MRLKTRDQSRFSYPVAAAAEEKKEKERAAINTKTDAKAYVYFNDFLLLSQ
jgi:hypothetical protein